MGTRAASAPAANARTYSTGASPSALTWRSKVRWRAPRRSGSVRCSITMCSSVPSKLPPRVCRARPRQSLGADHESGAGQWRLPAAGRGTPQTAPRRCPVSLPPLRGWVIPQPGSSGSVSSSSVSPCRRAHYARSPSRAKGTTTTASSRTTPAPPPWARVTSASQEQEQAADGEDDHRGEERVPRPDPTSAASWRSPR